MIRFFGHNVFVPFFCVLSICVRADIGETHGLKGDRDLLLQQRELLLTKEGDSPTEMQLEELTQKIIELDDRIFKSLEQTVERITTQKAQHTTNDRLLVMLAMTTSAITVFLFLMIMMVHNRVVERENTGLLGVYRQLSADFISKVSPEKTGKYRLLRVNVIVIMGLVMMGVSILAYLIASI